MSTLSVLQNLLVAGFVLVGALASVEWLRYRGLARFYQAAAIDLLALVSAVGQYASGAVWATPVTLTAFTASSVALVLFRGTFIPLSRRTQILLGVASVGLTAAYLIASLPWGHPAVSPLESAFGLALVALWAICLGEPAVRFLIAARDRPTVQRARLRALSAGYLAIVLILLAAATLGQQLRSVTAQIIIELIGLAVVPALWIAFSPPLWLRRMWRAREEEELRRAISVLLRFTEDRKTLAKTVLGWAARLVGGDAAFIVNPEGALLATSGIAPETAVTVLDGLGDISSPAVVPNAHGAASAIVVPVRTGDGDAEGKMVVLSGPFTPVFGTDEAGRLESYATAVSLGMERVRLTESLSAMERAKSAFLNLASHELRGPLTVIRGYVSMIAAGDFGSFPALETSVIPALMRQAEQMTMLVDQMIETARLEDERLDLHFGPVDIAELARGVVGDRAATLPATAHVSFESRVKDVSIETDELRVRTIIANLLDNAVKYSPDGGEIVCRVTTRDGVVAIAVADHGIGISDEDAKRLFTRFGRIVTPENAHIPGTGLGLYLCRELARRLGGDIVREPVTPHGSVFILTLPLVREASEAGEGQAEATGEPASGKRLGPLRQRGAPAN